jgi:hypothetical protein
LGGNNIFHYPHVEKIKNFNLSLLFRLIRKIHALILPHLYLARLKNGSINPFLGQSFRMYSVFLLQIYLFRLIWSYISLIFHFLLGIRRNFAFACQNINLICMLALFLLGFGVGNQKLDLSLLFVASFLLFRY